MYWTSVGDSGIVGSKNQAIATYDREQRGEIRWDGYLINQGQRTLILTHEGGMMYYSYNPAYNSQYVVDNID
ncbi:hypothetical protein AB1I63_07940 [Streptococcus pneumoniae]